MGGAKVNNLKKRKKIFAFVFIFYICTHQNIMENIATSLKVRCVQAGTTLKEVCARAGVTTATISNWGKREPKSIAIWRRLEAAIAEIEREKTGND